MTDIVYLSQLPAATALAGSDLIAVTQGSTGAGTGTTRKAAVSLLVNSGPILATGSTTARSLADRFGAWVDPMDFGAKWDSATDDTVAIQAAIAAAVWSRISVAYWDSMPEVAVSFNR